MNKIKLEYAKEIMHDHNYFSSKTYKPTTNPDIYLLRSLNPLFRHYISVAVACITIIPNLVHLSHKKKKNSLMKQAKCILQINSLFHFVYYLFTYITLEFYKNILLIL